MKKYFSRTFLFLLILPVIAITSVSYWYHPSHLAFWQEARAAGNTYYVATNGNDSNPCTQSSPCRTINHGITRLSSGDTLIIKGGTYNEYVMDLRIPIPSGTDWVHVTTIKGAPGEMVILQPTVGDPGGGGIITMTRSSYVSFENLILDGYNHQGVYVGIVTGGESTGVYAHHIRFKDMELRFLRWIAVGPGGSDPPPGNPEFLGGYNEFINLYIHDSGIEHTTSGPDDPAGATHFYVTSSNNLFDHITADGDNGSGKKRPAFAMQIYDAGYHQKNNNIIRNSIFRNYYGDGILLVNTNGTVIQNNLFYGNPGSGLSLLFGANTSAVRNNTFYANIIGIFVRDDAGSGNQIQNNIVYGNSSGAIVDNTGGKSVTLSNNLTNQDPRFVNASGGDFHLQSTSPAINAGMTLPEVPCDFDGNARPSGSGYDIGAYEYGGTPSSNCSKGGGALTPTPTPAPQPPTISISASPQSLSLPGQGTTLFWTTSGATSCTATGFWSGSQPTRGSIRFTPSLSSTYILTCTGSGGTNQASVTVMVGSSSTSCAQYTSQTPISSIPSGFGVPWDVTNPGVMLLKAECTPPTMVLKVGNPNTTNILYVYKTAYIAPSGAPSWTSLDLFGTPFITNAWYQTTAQGVATISDISQPTYTVAYTCAWTGSQWKCGCRDYACTQSYWQVQRIGG